MEYIFALIQRSLGGKLFPYTAIWVVFNIQNVSKENTTQGSEVLMSTEMVL